MSSPANATVTITDLVKAIRQSSLRLDKLRHLRPVFQTAGSTDPVMVSAGFSAVFKMRDQSTGRLSAVKCFLQITADRKDRYQRIQEHFRGKKHPWLLDFSYFDAELSVTPQGRTADLLCPVLLMTWQEGPTLGASLGKLCQARDKRTLHAFSQTWGALAQEMMSLGFAHGDLKADNIIVSGGGNFVLVDYDSMFVPTLAGRSAADLGGPSFQHPKRRPQDFGLHIDHFPMLVLGINLRALATDPEAFGRNLDGDHLLFRQRDFQNPDQSAIFQKLLAQGDPWLASATRALATSCRSTKLDIADIGKYLASLSNAPTPLDLASRVKELESAISASLERKSAFMIDAERAVEAVFLRHEAPLRAHADLMRRFGSRVAAARDRVRVYGQLQKALATGDEMTVHGILGSSAAVLTSVTEYQRLKSTAEQVSLRVDTINKFIAEATKPAADDETLCKLWESLPNLAQSSLSRKVVGALGGTPEDRYQRARRRIDAVRALKSLILAVTARSRGKISETDERSILAAYNDAEARVGSLDQAASGELHKRAILSEHRLDVFAKLHRLAQLPPERDGELARWWEGVAEASAYNLESLAERVGTAVQSWRLVQRFLVLVNRKPVDEDELVAFANANPSLATLPVARSQLIDGLAIPGRITLARDRISALAAVREVIRSTGTSQNKTEAGESAILVAWRTNENLLIPWEAARREVESRAERAAERLRRARLLQQAHADGDQAKALDAWGTDGVLADYLPAHSFKKFVEEAARIARGLAKLKERLRHHNHDDLAILMLARSCGSFLKTSFARQPLQDLNGRSIEQLVEFAQKRVQFIDRLVRTSSNPACGGALELAGAWDDEFDLNHPHIIPHRVFLEGALRETLRLENLIKAVHANQDEEIVRNWNDALFSKLPNIQDVADPIRSALKSYVERAAPFQPLGPGVTSLRSRGRWLVAWDWLDAAVTHAYVLIGDKRAPTDHRNALESRFVSRTDHAVKSGIEFAFAGNYLVAVVYPVLVFRGERLEGRNGLVLREHRRRVLKYRVHGGYTGLGSRVLEIEFDRATPTPELELVTADNGQLLSAWGEQQTDENGRISIDLGGGPSLKRRSVTLRLKSPMDAEWVEIVHPTERGRRIAG